VSELLTPDDERRTTGGELVDSDLSDDLGWEADDDPVWGTAGAECEAPKPA
jgi:hypothetical protein